MNAQAEELVERSVGESLVNDIYVLLLNQFAFCNGTAFMNAQAEALREKYR